MKTSIMNNMVDELRAVTNLLMSIIFRALLGQLFAYVANEPTIEML